MAVAAVLVPVILEHRRWRQVDQEFSHVAELQRGRLHGILFERKKGIETYSLAIRPTT